MAIQNRRGAYGNFDPSKMVAGEFAVVQNNDPNSSTGRSLYICFAPGVVKRIADYEDIQDMVADVAEGYIEDFDDAVTALTTLIPDTVQAKNDANAAAISANAAAAAANAAVAAIQEPLWVNMSTVSSLPVTLNNAKITSDMICSAYVLGTPSAQTGDWTITTANGSVTVSGTISGSTTLMLLLEKVESI